MNNCSCGSEKSFEKCCGRYVSGAERAPTPEALMRSRYTAYVMGEADYIEKTQTGKAAQDFDAEYIKAWSQQSKWFGLKIIATEENNDKGTVEFIARYELGGNKSFMHERSDFIKINDDWLYSDGKFIKTGRNDACPCCSNKKFKKCCGQ